MTEILTAGTELAAARGLIEQAFGEESPYSNNDEPKTIEDQKPYNRTERTTSPEVLEITMLSEQINELRRLMIGGKL